MQETGIFKQKIFLFYSWSERGKTENNFSKIQKFQQWLIIIWILRRIHAKQSIKMSERINESGRLTYIKLESPSAPTLSIMEVVFWTLFEQG